MAPTTHEARVDAHPHGELDAVVRRTSAARGLSLLDRERRTQGALGVIFVGDGRAEQRHDAVAQELVDRALVAVDRPRSPRTRGP